MYFNLTVNGTWQVQNMPVLSLAGVGNEQTATYYFDLGTPRGMDVNSLQYDYTFTEDTADTMPSGAVSAAVGNSGIALWPGLEGDGEMPELIPAHPLIGGEVEEGDAGVLRAYPNNPLYCGRLQSPMPVLSAKNVLNVEKTTPPSIFGLPPWPRTFRSAS